MNISIERKGRPESRPCIGLALSGGGPRGLAHIGVLNTLERQGIPVDVLAGTSMGGVIAAGYAAGLSPEDLEKEALATARIRRLLRLIDPGLPEAGLLRGQRMQSYFEEILGAMTFEDLKTPLALVAVDLNAQRKVILTEGSLSLAIRATISVPGIFTPVEIDGQRLVDGGVLNNLPIDAAQHLGADVIIAVDVESDPNKCLEDRINGYGKLPNGLASTLAIVDEVSQLMMRTIKENNMRRNPPDVLIRAIPPKTVNIFAGYSRVRELIEIGEKAAEEALPTIREHLSLQQISSPAHPSLAVSDDKI
jgi:NTE family protein